MPGRFTSAEVLTGQRTEAGATTDASQLIPNLRRGSGQMLDLRSFIR
jgi:hypothetical protein